MDFDGNHSAIKTALEDAGYRYITLETWRKRIEGLDIPHAWDNNCFTITPPILQNTLEDMVIGDAVFGVEFVLKTVNDKYLAGLESIRDDIKNAGNNSYMLNIMNTEEIGDDFLLVMFPNAFKYTGA